MVFIRPLGGYLPLCVIRPCVCGLRQERSRNYSGCGRGGGSFYARRLGWHVVAEADRGCCSPSSYCGCGGGSGSFKSAVFYVCFSQMVDIATRLFGEVLTRAKTVSQLTLAFILGLVVGLVKG